MREHGIIVTIILIPIPTPSTYRAVRWLDRKSFAFQWLTFAVSWWVLQVRFCWRPLEYTLRDVLFLGDAFSGAAPQRHRRRQSSRPPLITTRWFTFPPPRRSQSGSRAARASPSFARELYYSQSLVVRRRGLKETS